MGDAQLAAETLCRNERHSFVDEIETRALRPCLRDSMRASGSVGGRGEALAAVWAFRRMSVTDAQNAPLSGSPSTALCCRKMTSGQLRAVRMKTCLIALQGRMRSSLLRFHCSSGSSVRPVSHSVSLMISRTTSCEGKHKPLYIMHCVMRRGPVSVLRVVLGINKMNSCSYTPIKPLSLPTTSRTNKHAWGVADTPCSQIAMNGFLFFFCL